MVGVVILCIVEPLSIVLATLVISLILSSIIIVHMSLTSVYGVVYR